MVGAPRVLRLGMLLLFALAASPAAAAEPAPVPWTLTGTSAGAPSAAPASRVERRRLQKVGRVATRAGLSYLSRGDLYLNPGVSMEAGFYPLEYLGVDVVSATVFFPSLGQTARSLREQTGRLPDAQRLRARVTTGARFAFAYGKVLVELLDLVLHFDLSVAGHAGIMVTHEATNFVADLGLGTQILVGEHLLVWLEASWVMGNEARTEGAFTGGVMGTAGVGWLF